MFLGEISRTGIFITTLSNVQPFIYRGYTGYYSLKTEWGTSCDDIFTTGVKEKVLQVNSKFLNKYLKVESYINMLSQIGSWYYDVPTNSIYIHVSHDSSPVTVYFDYGKAFGVSTNGVIYIDDFSYLPIVKSFPSIECESDSVGQSAPTGIVGSITLNNMTYKESGILDFLLTESIQGYEFILYNYDTITTSLEETDRFTIKSIDLSLQECSISLEDKRMS